jgi:hypothetical protein
MGEAARRLAEALRQFVRPAATPEPVAPAGPGQAGA